MYTEIDRKSTIKIREELQKLVKGYAKKNGLVINFGNASYTAADINLKTNVHIAGIPTKTESAMLFKIKQHNLKTEVFFGGKILELVEFRARSWKRPWIVKHENGKLYKYSEDFVNANFKKEK